MSLNSSYGGIRFDRSECEIKSSGLSDDRKPSVDGLVIMSNKYEE